MEILLLGVAFFAAIYFVAKVSDLLQSNNTDQLDNNSD
jgi:hypothetical protein